MSVEQIEALVKKMVKGLSDEERQSIVLAIDKYPSEFMDALEEEAR